MSNIDVSWLEGLLKKHAAGRSVARVLSAQSDRALGPGENYMSDIARITLRVVLGSGRNVDKSVIVKIKCDKSAQFLENYDMFNNEIKVYTELTPEYDRLMDEFGDVDDHLWADCYGSTGAMIVFEDLKVKGFMLANRREGLDMDHALFTIRGLARLHAISVAAVRRGRINATQLPQLMFTRNDRMANKFANGGVAVLADVMTSSWDPKWKGTVEKLRELETTFGNKLDALYKLDTKFKVVNHGDCWTNNMLFRYETGTKRPIAVRFVDFQLTHYHSYAWDLSYFLYSSVKLDVRSNRMEELLDAYHTTLLSCLQLYGYPRGDAPSREDVSAEMDKFLLFGMMVSTTMTPIMWADPKDAMDMDSMTDNSVDLVHTPEMYLNPNYRKVLEGDLEYFTSKGLL